MILKMIMMWRGSETNLQQEDDRKRVKIWRMGSGDPRSVCVFLQIEEMWSRRQSKDQSLYDATQALACPAMDPHRKPHKSLIYKQPPPLINAQILTLDEQFIKHTWSSKMTSPANPALAACKAFLANLQSVHYCQGNMDLQLYGNVWNIQNWTLSHYIKIGSHYIKRQIPAAASPNSGKQFRLCMRIALRLEWHILKLRFM